MIYLDNAATTRMAPEVLEAMLPYFAEDYGNPGAIYTQGARARKAVAKARENIAGLIGARSEEIFFTAGGTEADNWALRAVAEAYEEQICSGQACERKIGHIITTKIEHHAVLHTCEYLEKRGFEITYLDVDKCGMISLEELKRAIRPDTFLISVMTANNEVGTLQPIAEIGALAHAKGILFHTDAVQAFGQIPLDVQRMQIDLLSASAHKLNGPKGVGCLYIRSGVQIGALIHGGAQERSRRAGTENVPGIVGFGAAAVRAQKLLTEKQDRERSLRDHMIRRLLQEIPDCYLNGHPDERLPGNVNVAFEDVEAESLLIRLDMQGVCASAGSACTSGSLDPSHVLLAMGLTPMQARSSVRFTLSGENTQEEIDEAVELIKQNVLQLRKMSFAVTYRLEAERQE